ncbi:MAG TPA: response regulator transcription factor [Planktothrix sp.]
MAKILLVEDDRELCSMFQKWLKGDHIIEVVYDGSTGLDYLKFHSYDAVVLDWELPGMSGPEVCQAYRARGGKTPVLMLTGKSQIADKLIGFDAGADDYLTKPFHPLELTARLQALLKRPPGLIETTIRIRGLELNAQTHTVQKAGKQLHLMPKEFALLEFFMKHPNQPFNQDSLLNRVWPSDSDVSTESIKAYIAKLRRKIEEPGEPPMITTVHGVGYRFEAAEDPG